MDGYLAAIEARLKQLEAAVYGNPILDEDQAKALEAAPAQTLHPSRMPAAPGLPIAPYDPVQHQDDATDAAIAAENDARQRNPAYEKADADIAAENAQTDFGDGSDPATDPTLNADGTTRRRRGKTYSEETTPDSA